MIATYCIHCGTFHSGGGFYAEHNVHSQFLKKNHYLLRHPHDQFCDCSDCLVSPLAGLFATFRMLDGSIAGV
jgi:hypothetical protein